jgi:hypothetical protein
MQIVVLAVTMPSLLLMSRTRAYTFLRIAVALFAGVASVGWISDRLFNVHKPVDVVVGASAHHAAWTAGSFFLISFGFWRLHSVFDQPLTTTARSASSDSKLRSELSFKPNAKILRRAGGCRI